MPTRAARQLGTRHRQERARIGVLVRGGKAVCVLCGLPIEKDALWDLDHKPDLSGYRGPTHQSCNRSDGAKRGNAKRYRHSRVW